MVITGSPEEQDSRGGGEQSGMTDSERPATFRRNVTQRVIYTLRQLDGRRRAVSLPICLAERSAPGPEYIVFF